MVIVYFDSLFMGKINFNNFSSTNNEIIYLSSDEEFILIE
jgi:hypothetical protein